MENSPREYAERKVADPMAQHGSADQERPPESLDPADVGRRVAAAFIDACVIAVLFFGLGWLGHFTPLQFIHSTLLFWLVPVAYAMVRDTYRHGRPLSMGKRLAKLGVVTSTGGRPDLVNSIQRNILFFFPPLALCMAGLELYLIIRTTEHKRFGDHFGRTLVVQQAS